MTTRNLTLSAVFIALGFVINTFCPPLFFGLKPDFMLIFLFIIILSMHDLRLTMVVSLAAGILVAFTTTFPGGQIPNIIDKAAIGMITYFCIPLLKGKNLNVQAIYVFFGSLMSGIIFLLTASLLYGVSGDISRMIVMALLPLALINGLFFIPLKRLFDRFYKQGVA